MTSVRINLPCSCGKKGCPNLISISASDGQVWVTHELGGGPHLLYTTRDRLHTFGNKLAKATGVSHERREKEYRVALEAIFHSGDPGTFEHRTAAKALHYSSAQRLTKE
jgi:hypothetical protein